MPPQLPSQNQSSPRVLQGDLSALSPALKEFVDLNVTLCQPDALHICDGSEEENRAVLTQLEEQGLIKKLLTADLTKRYGCLKGGATDVRKHKWFASTDWDALIGKTAAAPIIPEIKNPTDTSNFDPYPDSVEEPDLPVYTGKDPFENF